MSTETNVGQIEKRNPVAVKLIAEYKIQGVGLVVVRDNKVVGLHCSEAELHAGQAAIIQHGNHLENCQLYFSRRPCATCLKMIINAGVSRIFFWPGDPEISMLKSNSSKRSQFHSQPVVITEEAALDAVATEMLKSNSCSHICVLLQPLTPGLAQFVQETSRECDFMERVSEDQPCLDTVELFNKERRRHLGDFCEKFLVGSAQQHREILTHMGLKNFCLEPYFYNLRHNMRELVELLASVAAGVPQHHHGFYRGQCLAKEPSLANALLLPPCDGVSQKVAHHCIVQARLLSYRTEDPKVGVGAVIWTRGRTAGSDGVGGLCLIGCGYNAYPAGSQYAEYPQMDDKQEDRQKRKYRYIIHAEQNALTFRARDIRVGEPTLLFVTKCPCDECIPLIRGAGITHIYTTDQDKDKDKGDISYLRFSSLKGIKNFTWQRSPSLCSASSPHATNGCVGKHSLETETENHSSKKQCNGRSHTFPSVN
ncbi:cytidine and dCMP deaminase domain-containing protein 1 isoform X2 [Cynoglossus semilaevis]|uniref:cytidine and dCMP deaminase domain-containing protein 1 isoform X2 n=1 Tax=Cynoglossus semilaevis TaxID=244447 RepID=UPI0004970F57|nr:cytidine and dCMP deaminase domain-containing protein 1 isoform X2 [Cynoglossus semilaevis]XP_008322900.1 cytidine and dCMP deaminase domain-containing protein 1 isoform X2 [Cynoglossus semilaevis]